MRIFLNQIAILFVVIFSITSQADQIQTRSDREIAENPRNLKELSDLADRLNKKSNWGVNAYILQYAIENVPYALEAIECAEKQTPRYPDGGLICFRVVIANLVYSKGVAGAAQPTPQLREDLKRTCYAYNIANSLGIEMAERCFTEIQ